MTTVVDDDDDSAVRIAAERVGRRPAAESAHNMTQQY